MKKKIILPVLFLLFGSMLNAQDAYLDGLTIGKYLATGVNYSIKVNLKNHEGYPITSCSVKWQIDNGTVHSTPVNIGGGGVTSSNYLPVTLTPSLNLSSEGEYDLKVWVYFSGDTNHDNDTLYKAVTALSSYATGRVLIEDYTATWCQYCPAANTVINTLSSNSRVVVASFHNSDMYSFTNGENYMESYYSGSISTPGAIVNRGEMGTYTINSNHPTWSSDVTGRIGISPVDFQLDFDIDNDTRTLDYTVTTNFKYAMSGDYYLNVYVLENNIQGSQTNATNPYTHQHVVRTMLGGIDGIGGVIPETPVLNTDYIYQNTYIIPSTWNIDQIEVIAYVYEKNNLNQTAVLNAASKKSQTGVEDEYALQNKIQIYPNPVTDNFVLQYDLSGNETYCLNIYNAAGEFILSKILNNVQNQKVNIAEIKPGFYFGSILKGNEKIQQFKIVKE